jgi:hypothetical protein
VDACRTLVATVPEESSPAPARGPAELDSRARGGLGGEGRPVLVSTTPLERSQFIFSLSMALDATFLIT